MKQRLTILALLLLAGLVGCAAPAPAVPENATLLFYGQSPFELPGRPAPGQYWLYDETAGRTVYVITIDASAEARSLDFSNLKPGHRYRLYRVDALAPAQP